MRTTPARFPAKTEAESKLYAVDASAELDTGVSLVSAAWVSVPAGLKFSSTTNTSTKAQALISGGTAETDYLVSVLLTTDESPAQVFEAMPRLKVIEGRDA